MRYRSYWAIDDFLNKSLQSEIDPSLNPLFTKKSRLKEYTFEYQTMPESYTSTQQRLINVLKQRYATKILSGMGSSILCLHQRALCIT